MARPQFSLAGRDVNKAMLVAVPHFALGPDRSSCAVTRHAIYGPTDKRTDVLESGESVPVFVDSHRLV